MASKFPDFPKKISQVDLELFVLSRTIACASYGNTFTSTAPTWRNITNNQSAQSVTDGQAHSKLSFFWELVKLEFYLCSQEEMALSKC